MAFQRFSILKKGVRRETEFGKGLGEERGERRTKSEGQKRSTIVKEARNHRHEIPRIGLCLKAMSEEREGYSPIRAFIQDCVVIENDKLGNESVSPKNTVYGRLFQKLVKCGTLKRRERKPDVIPLVMI